MEDYRSIRNYSRFDLYSQNVPDNLSEGTGRFLLWARDAIHTAEIKGISDVVAYTPLSWAWNINSIHLIVFAAFESRISLIDQLSESLAPIYHELLLLPIISPIRLSSWPLHVENESILFRHVTNKSIYAFSSGD
jgi:hypothetical protein